MDDAEDHRCRWWVLCDHTLKDTLIRAQTGEDPDLLMTELYANSVQEG